MHKASVVVACCPRHAGVFHFPLASPTISWASRGKWAVGGRRISPPFLGSEWGGSWFLDFLPVGLFRISFVELSDCIGCIVEVFVGVPDFVLFWSVSFPLSSVLELVVVESRVDDFVEFVFVFSFYLNRRRGFLYLRGESVVLVRFKKRYVDGVVYLHRGWKGQLIYACSNHCQDFAWSNFPVVQFLQRLCSVDVAWQEPHHIS